MAESVGLEVLPLYGGGSILVLYPMFDWWSVPDLGLWRPLGNNVIEKSSTS